MANIKKEILDAITQHKTVTTNEIKKLAGIDDKFSRKGDKPQITETVLKAL